ncbi:hypothetical protein ABL840_04965 [Variovorax sp. NFACC27]|uniref:hypothetical protein n=1 Tax=unclassified Variovorax TaxID=663243 RepID=UPI000B890097
MNGFEAHVKGMKVDEQRALTPSDIGMELRQFHLFADRLIGIGYAVGDMNFLGRHPHRESETGHDYIDALVVERIL